MTLRAVLLTLDPTITLDRSCLSAYTATITEQIGDYGHRQKNRGQERMTYSTNTFKSLTNAEINAWLKQWMKPVLDNQGPK